MWGLWCHSQDYRSWRCFSWPIIVGKCSISVWEWEWHWITPPLSSFLTQNFITFTIWLPSFLWAQRPRAWQRQGLVFKTRVGHFKQFNKQWRMSTLDSKTWCLRRHYWCWWQCRGWGWCWRTWGCPVLSRDVLGMSSPVYRGGGWSLALALTITAWTLASVRFVTRVTRGHQVSSQSQARVSGDWPMRGQDTGDTVTMPGAVQDTQDPRGHQGWSHVTLIITLISS